MSKKTKKPMCPTHCCYYQNCGCKEVVVLLSGQKVIKHKKGCKNEKIIKPK